MSDNHIHPSTRPATKNVDRAGGVPTPRWHVAIVNHNAEHTIARTIAARGIPTYVASQPQLRIWRDGRRHHIDHVVIPSTIFIHCTEPQRRTLLQTTPGLHRFLIDRATATRPRPATIPDQQIQRLRFMLGATDTPVEFIRPPPPPGPARPGLPGRPRARPPARRPPPPDDAKIILRRTSFHSKQSHYRYGNSQNKRMPL